MAVVVIKLTLKFDALLDAASRTRQRWEKKHTAAGIDKETCLRQEAAFAELIVLAAALTPSELGALRSVFNQMEELEREIMDLEAAGRPTKHAVKKHSKIGKKFERMVKVTSNKTIFDGVEKKAQSMAWQTRESMTSEDNEAIAFIRELQQKIFLARERGRSRQAGEIPCTDPQDLEVVKKTAKAGVQRVHEHLKAASPDSDSERSAPSRSSSSGSLEDSSEDSDAELGVKVTV